MVQQRPEKDVDIALENVFIMDHNKSVEEATMEQPTKEAVLSSDGVHYFCKDIIREASNHDPVDAIKDVGLALAVLKYEYDKVMAPHRQGGQA
jgi:hypothetical protein